MTTLCLQSPLGTRDYSKCTHASQPIWALCKRLFAREQHEHIQHRSNKMSQWEHLRHLLLIENHSNISPEQSGSDQAITNLQPAPTWYPYSSGCFWSSTPPCLHLKPFLSQLTFAVITSIFYFPQVNIERSNVTSISYIFKRALDNNYQEMEELQIWTLFNGWATFGGGNAALCCVPWSVLTAPAQVCSFLWSAASAEAPAREQGQCPSQL